MPLAGAARWSSLVGVAGVLVLAACAGAGAGAAAGGVAPAGLRITCGAGETGAAALFCGARPGGPASAVCALPGRTARAGLLGMGLYGVRLADSTILEAKAEADSVSVAAVGLGDSPRGADPCGRRLLMVQREWRESDSATARLLFDAVSARLARLHAAPLTIRCGWTRGPQPQFRQMAVGGRLTSYIDLQRYQATDSAEAARRRGEDEYLRTLRENVVLSAPAPTTVVDSAALRTRYSVRAAVTRSAGGNELNSMTFAFAPVSDGASACARLRARAWR